MDAMSPEAYCMTVMILTVLHIVIGIEMNRLLKGNSLNPLWKLFVLLFWPIGAVMFVLKYIVVNVIADWITEVKQYYERKGR